MDYILKSPGDYTVKHEGDRVFIREQATGLAFCVVNDNLWPTGEALPIPLGRALVAAFVTGKHCVFYAVTNALETVNERG